MAWEIVAWSKGICLSCRDDAFLETGSSAFFDIIHVHVIAEFPSFINEMGLGKCAVTHGAFNIVDEIGLPPSLERMQLLGGTPLNIPIVNIWWSCCFGKGGNCVSYTRILIAPVIIRIEWIARSAAFKYTIFIDIFDMQSGMSVEVLGEMGRLAPFDMRCEGIETPFSRRQRTLLPIDIRYLQSVPQEFSSIFY